MRLAHRVGFVAGVVLVLLAAGPARASIIVQGFAYAVADEPFFEPGVGNHFHSRAFIPDVIFGNPPGLAEVGGYPVSEEVRGISEYNLAGLAAVPSAFVTFDVYSARGLFNGRNDLPFAGDIDVFAFVGNNTEDLTDYERPTTAFVGRFNTAGLAPGNVLSLNVTSVFNAAVLNGQSLGIRLQVAPGTDVGTPTPPNGRARAWVFNNFRLTTDNQSTLQTPEPAAVAVFGLVAVGALARRRRAG